VHRKATLGGREEGMRRRLVRGFAHGRVEGRPGGLHRKAILGCRKGVRCRPVRCFAHGRDGQVGAPTPVPAEAPATAVVA
jgi:hypothetical protein